MGAVSTSVALTPFQLNYSEAEQFRQIVRQHGVDLRVSIPAFLAEDMDVTTQTVTVQIAIQERVRTQKGAQWWDLPPIRFVPIAIPRGGGFSITLPLKKGDEGLLVFCDACFDNWWLNGQNNAPRAQNIDPSQPISGSQTQLSVRRHDFWDCGFIPGMFSQPNILTNYSTSSLQIRSDDGDTIIDVAEAGVTITADAVNVEDIGGTPQALMNDTFFQWYQTNIQPFLVSKGYAGPGIPAGSETTILKGQ